MVEVVWKEIGLGAIISKCNVVEVIESPRLPSSRVGPYPSNHQTDHKEQDL